jgi:hypothetical protein
MFLHILTFASIRHHLLRQCSGSNFHAESTACLARHLSEDRQTVSHETSARLAARHLFRKVCTSCWQMVEGSKPMATGFGKFSVGRLSLKKASVL